LRKIKGHYYAYFYDRSRDPKSKSYPLRVSTKERARTLLGRLEAEYAAGAFDPWHPQAFPASRSGTYRELVVEFVAYLKAERRRPKTVSHYEWILNDFARHVSLPPGTPISRVTDRQLRAYVKHDDTVSDATKANRYRHLKAFLRWTVKQGFLKASPLDEVGPPEVARIKREFLQPEEIAELLRYMSEDYPATIKRGVAPDTGWLSDIIAFAFTTGLRRGEICNLRWKDISLKDRWVTVRSTTDFRTKSGHERVVDLAGAAWEVISRLADEKPHPTYVFTGPKGDPLTAPDAQQRLSRRFKSIARMAGLGEYRFHDLRHGAASWLVASGEHLAVVKEIMGHSSISVTEQYAHVARDQKRAAMAKAPTFS